MEWKNAILFSIDDTWKFSEVYHSTNLQLLDFEPQD